MTRSGRLPDPFTLAEVGSDNLRIELFKSELAMCSTFSVLATIKYGAGNRYSAERSLGHAEEAYAAALPLASDPKHSKHFTGEIIQEFTAELDRLREKLDELQRLLQR